MHCPYYTELVNFQGSLLIVLLEGLLVLLPFEQFCYLPLLYINGSFLSSFCYVSICYFFLLWCSSAPRKIMASFIVKADYFDRILAVLGCCELWAWLKSTKTKTNQATFDAQTNEGNITIPTAEEKREPKAAAKCKRAKEKTKEAKAKERERSEQEQKMKEVEARKAYSAVKCSFCGWGI
jgi:hypothetical protein